MRSPVAHGLLRRSMSPNGSANAVFTANISPASSQSFGATAKGLQTFGGANPCHQQTALSSARSSPCAWRKSRGEAEDIAGTVTVEFDELPVVTDMLAACQPGSPLVHDEWDDNISLHSAKTVRSKSGENCGDQGHRTIRTARQCILPMEGRGVIAYRDSRLRHTHAHHVDAVSSFGADRLERMPRPRPWSTAHHFARRRRRLRLQGLAVPRGGGARPGWRCRSISGTLARGSPRASRSPVRIAASTTIRSPAMPPLTASYWPSIASPMSTPAPIRPTRSRRRLKPRKSPTYCPGRTSFRLIGAEPRRWRPTNARSCHIVASPAPASA